MLQRAETFSINNQSKKMLYFPDYSIVVDSQLHNSKTSRCYGFFHDSTELISILYIFFGTIITCKAKPNRLLILFLSNTVQPPYAVLDY